MRYNTLDGLTNAGNNLLQRTPLRQFVPQRRVNHTDKESISPGIDWLVTPVLV
jgi:hypothetical protein